MSFINPFAQQTTTAITPFRKPVTKTENERIVAIDHIAYNNSDPKFWYDQLHKPGAPHVDHNGDPLSFRLCQSQMFDALQDAPGGFFAVGTGHGKSYVAILAGSVMHDVQRVIAFTTKSAVPDLEGTYLYLRQFYHVVPNFSAHVIDSMSSPRPNSDMDLIEELLTRSNIPLEQTVLVFDEVHKLKNPTSARGGRLMRCLENYPQVRVVVLSGSMMSTTIRDSAHLAWAALRDLSPYPRTFGVDDRKTNEATLKSWSNCLDVDGEPVAADWQVMQPLWNWAYPDKSMLGVRSKERRSLMRQALQKRLRCCPGVVVSADSAVDDVALVLIGIDDTQLVIPESVQNKINLVLAGVAPNEEDQLSDGSSGWGIIRQLAQGFYYIWDWPGGIKDADWIAARKNWNSFVRKEILEHADVKYDSAMLVYNSVKHRIRAMVRTQEELDWLEFVSRTDMDDDRIGEKFERGTEAFARCLASVSAVTRQSGLLNAWVRWSAVEKHKPEPPRKPVWVDTFAVDFAVAWAKRHAPEPVIIWYEHLEIEQALRQRGIPCFGADTLPPENNPITCGMSIAVQGTGKNLQRWNTALVLCPPASGQAWEQLLARMHRPGQKATCVRWFVLTHVKSFTDAINSAREKGNSVFEILGNVQKLDIAEYQNIELKQLTTAT